MTDPEKEKEPIDINSWHWKVYCFNSQLCAAWRGNEDFNEYPYHGRLLGLCPYMRMIFLWGPLVALTYLLPIGAIATAFYFLPTSAGGTGGVLWLVGVILSFAAFVAAIVWALGKQKEIRERRPAPYLRKERDEPTTVTFRSMLFDWLKSMKSKVCPVLVLPDDK